jgi:hypothetical protein
VHTRVVVVSAFRICMAVSPMGSGDGKSTPIALDAKQHAM